MTRRLHGWGTGVQDRISRLEAEVARLGREIDEARQQQSATADVLKLISHSSFDLDAVLKTLIGSAIELCKATRGVIWLRKGENLRLAAHMHYPEEWVTFARDLVLTPAADAATASEVAAHTGEVVNVEDLSNDPRFRSLAGPGLGDYRGALAVPLKRDGRVEGVIALRRPEARLFTDRQIALVQTFADQAVIAIENARLFSELDIRNREVTEALQQQTATSEVLKVISRSAFDLPTVLHALINSAATLCNCGYGGIYLRDGDRLRLGTTVGTLSEESEEIMNLPPALDRKTIAGRVATSGRIEHIPDVDKDMDYDFPAVRQYTDTRALMGVPLLRDGKVEGVFYLGKPEPGAFTSRQSELAQTFADQAVIAIENARLFDELKERTTELTEALEQQTATAGVLDVISRSIGQTEPVFEAILHSAAHLCDTSFAHLALCEDDGLRHAAVYGGTPEWEAYRQEHPILRPLPSSAIGRVLATKMPVHIHDAVDDQAFRDGDPGRLSVVNLLGARTILSVPLLKGSGIVGVITLHRLDVRPFSEKQIALVSNFASQAVIAIENARLLAELEARNREILSRYFSPNLADRLAVAGVDEMEFSGQRRDVAVLFSDIEGFTSLVETMEPGMLGELLNGYLAGMTSIVFSHEGTVAKIVGDALHVLFGAPGDQPDRAARAVACALDLDLFSQSFRKLWSEKGVALGPTRIGVNSGPAIVGNFGGGRFFDYTAYGDTINTAARLETANKQIGTRVCISESVVSQLPDFRGRPVGDLMLRGKTEPLRAYEPLPPDDRDDLSIEGYLKAFARLEASDPGAMGAFAAEVGKQPDDRLAGFHLKRLLNGGTGTRIHLD